MGRIGRFASAALIYTLALVLYPLRMFKRSKREYGLTPEHRDAEIRRKFGEVSQPAMRAMLSGVREPTEQVLGAVVFLATRIDQVPALVELANSDREQLLRAAVVKDARG